MYLLRPITAILLASSSPSPQIQNPNPSDLRFTMGFDLATEADEFLNDGKCEKAIPLYEEAIAIARKPALALHQQQQHQQQQQQQQQQQLIPQEKQRRCLLCSTV